MDVIISRKGFDRKEQCFTTIDLMCEYYRWTDICVVVKFPQHAGLILPLYERGDKGGLRPLMLSYNKELLLYSRELRNNMTDAERRLWVKLRRKQLKGCQFYRQKIIGNYIVDFYCPKARLVIEVDGSQHYSEEMMEADRRRDDFLRANALTVIRFSDLEVFRNLDGVIERILEFL